MKHAFLILTGLVIFTFKVNSQITVTDSRDGNVYQTVIIGSQIWMAENLRYLPYVAGPASGSTTTSFYYVYDYNGSSVADAINTANYNTYGVLYNWPAAMNGAASSTANPSGVQGVCPTGWHLPSDAEWTQLIDFLGGDSVAGGKLKETDTIHWFNPNIGATNETGFTALPGGFRYDFGIFYGIGIYGDWWSTTAIDSNSAWRRGINYNLCGIGRNNTIKSYGFSIRCVKDSLANKIIEIKTDKYFQIFPNPAIDRFTISVVEFQNARMRLYDMVGKCILSENLRNGFNYIDIGMLNKGIYIIHIDAESYTHRMKLIKE